MMANFASTYVSRDKFVEVSGDKNTPHCRGHVYLLHDTVAFLVEASQSAFLDRLGSVKHVKFRRISATDRSRIYGYLDLCTLYSSRKLVSVSD